MVTLTIDAASGKTEKTIIAQHIEEEFMGGRGTNTKLFHDMTEGIVDALSGKNPIIFGTGPLTGTPFPMGGRFEVTTKSPQTGTIFTSSCGGWFGVSLKKSGIDTLIVTGAAETPSYIFIEEGTMQIAPAGHLWGQGKKQVKEWLREKHGRNISILLIGRAGENLIPFSNIENDGRYLGRGGLGAVLGSKKIKAIVVKGKGKIPVADKEGFLSSPTNAGSGFPPIPSLPRDFPNSAPACSSTTCVKLASHRQKISDFLLPANRRK